MLTTRLFRYLLLVMSGIFFIFLQCTIYSINLNTCRVVQSKDSFIILLTMFSSILIVVTYKIIFISFNIHQFTRYWTFTFVILLLCNNLYSFSFSPMLATCWLFSIVIQKKKRKKGQKIKCINCPLILQSLHFYFLQRLSDNIAIISLVGNRVKNWSISVVVFCKLLFGSISAWRERKILEEGDVRYSMRWTFHDIPGTILYSNEKIGEVSYSQRDFFLDPKCTCTDFRNIHTWNLYWSV